MAVFKCGHYLASFRTGGQALADTSAYDNKSAVILSYQRIGEDHSPETNIRIEQFQSHIQELIDGDYNVLPLPRIINAIKEEKELPPNSIAITFDGGYSSILEHALPLLHEHELPYTIFVAANLLDNIPSHISKSDIRKLRRNKLVTWGIHPASYIRLSGAQEEEIRRQINNAKAALRQITGKRRNFSPIRSVNIAFHTAILPLAPDLMPRLASTPAPCLAATIYMACPVLP